MYYESKPNEHFHTKTNIYNNSMRNECREEKKSTKSKEEKKLNSKLADLSHSNSQSI